MYFTVIITLFALLLFLFGRIFYFLAKFIFKEENREENIINCMYSSVASVILASILGYLLTRPDIQLSHFVLLGKLLILLLLVITLHELGHYIAAKSLGLRVDEFSIGFGKKLGSFRFRETNVTIHLLPIKGHVKPEENIDDKLNVFQLCYFFLAGITVNLASFIFSTGIIFAKRGESFVDGIFRGVSVLGEIFPKVIQNLTNINLEDIYTPAHNMEATVGFYFSLSELTVDMWMAFATISLILAVINLIPIPVLDGGRVVLAVLSSIAGLFGVPKNIRKNISIGLLIFGALLLFSPIVINNIWSSVNDLGISLIEYILWMLLTLTIIINLTIYMDNRRKTDS